ncbi:MAG: RNA 2',3'-cyclic phosphodiesterase [Candidatus Acidiferrales bacterium]
MRLFVAITPPEEIRQRLIRTMEQLKPLSRWPRWVRPEGLHLTLKFLGDVEPEQLDAVVAALREVRAARPIEIQFRGVGSFSKHDRPRVLWAGLRESEELAALAASVERRMLALGFANEEREFSPHITLARIQSPEGIDNLARAAAAFASYDFGTMHVREFQLFQSTLRPTGAEYAWLRNFCFVQDAE